MRGLSRIFILVACLASILGVPARGVPADGATTAAATTAPSVSRVSREAGPPPSTLRFFNRDVMTFRSAFFGYQPTERVAVAYERIRLALGRGGPGVVTVTKATDGLAFAIDGAHVFRLLEGDLDAEDGETFEQAQVVVTKRLEDAIASSRQAGKGRVLVRGLLLGGAATLVLLVAVWIASRIRLLIRRRIDAQLTARLHLGLEERVGILRLIKTVGQIIFVAVVAVLVEEWLRFVFGLFPYNRPRAEQLTGSVQGMSLRVARAT